MLNAKIHGVSIDWLMSVLAVLTQLSVSYCKNRPRSAAWHETHPADKDSPETQNADQHQGQGPVELDFD